MTIVWSIAIALIFLGAIAGVTAFIFRDLDKDE